MSDLTVIILTFNEELHIARAIQSVKEIAKDVFIVDSFSIDSTLAIAEQEGATILQNKFVNQAKQFQWALDHCAIQTKWVLRLDADEYLTAELVNEIKLSLPALTENVSGVIFKRRLYFMGKWIKHGGYYPVHLLRMWRNGHAMVEQREMDEHMILLQGKAVTFKHDIVDDNLNSLSWWTDKHNSYATREAVAYLCQKHCFTLSGNKRIDKGLAKQTAVKRWYKNEFYYRLPPLIRACTYFVFRFWIRMGFLDGTKGLIWHFLQAYWYRFLVDAKIIQIEWQAQKAQMSVKEMLVEHYGVDL